MPHPFRRAACAAALALIAPAALAAPPRPAAQPAALARLAAAAANGDTAEIGALAAKGADLDAALDADGTRAVSIAAVRGQLAALELLLSRGAAPNPVVRSAALLAAAGGGAPADTATVVARGPGVAALEILLRYGAAPDGQGQPALAAALLRCDPRAVELLVRFGARVTPLSSEARGRCGAALAATIDANVPGTDAFAARWRRIGQLVEAAVGASKRNDHEAARRSFEEVTALVSRSPGMHRMLAAEYAALGDEESAYRHRARYLELAPGTDHAVAVRRDLLASAPAKRALASGARPPWAVRWRCDGTDPAECRDQCARGNGGSCLALAKLAFEGKAGRAASVGEARGYTERGCDLGNRDACYFMGKAHYIGWLGVPKDLDKALAFAERGCGVETQISCHLVGSVILAQAAESGDPQPADVERAVAIFETMCQQADTLGCGSLGFMLHLDLTGAHRVAEGVSLLDRACREGWDAACTRVAEIHSQGLGVPRDQRKADQYGAMAAKLPKSGAGLPRAPQVRARTADASPRTCGTVRERLDSPPYVLLRLETPSGDRWVAGAIADFRPGALACVRDATEVRDFESKALHRRFDAVRFGTLERGPP